MAHKVTNTSCSEVLFQAKIKKYKGVINRSVFNNTEKVVSKYYYESSYLEEEEVIVEKKMGQGEFQKLSEI